MKRSSLLHLVVVWSLFFQGRADSIPLLTPDHIPLEAIIFDCDGVIVDTEFLKFQAWEKALKIQGFSFKIEDYEPLVGRSGRAIAKALKILKESKAPKKTLDEEKLLLDRNNIYKEIQKDPANIPPIMPVIRFIKEVAALKGKYGYKIGLASSAPLKEIQANLRAHGLEKIFDTIISGGDQLKDIFDPEGTNKPKPYIYSRLAKWMRVKPAHCLVFEDTEAGVEAAHKAGMTVYAVPNDFTRSHNFELAKKVLSLEEISMEKLFGSQQ